jgi:hypothetical protein
LIDEGLPFARFAAGPVFPLPIKTRQWKAD